MATARAALAWIARANHVPLDTCLALSINGRFLEQVAALEKNLNIDQNGSISFPEFVTWFSTVGFNTNVTLSAKERSFREFCAENALSLVDMDRYKKYFVPGQQNTAEYDMDESGEIDQEEFEALIRRCARVPRHLEIPATRMKQFWAQAEEFALFYRKFFEADGVGGKFLPQCSPSAWYGRMAVTGRAREGRPVCRFSLAGFLHVGEERPLAVSTQQGWLFLIRQTITAPLEDIKQAIDGQGVSFRDIGKGKIAGMVRSKVQE
ncbi:hypothetical protein AK812_SmicGene27327 [Symbiodinium microadriaticum]|uniref:EF-hand domain-containing protein n=1 Tax=Symbiodinium microadriaticum TaxID=2951 RepID=A0A1Q9D768_SYMMI|nr:hypothetical protein AK812_SmicGene27327 [Symbiodinium microadriaticum]